MTMAMKKKRTIKITLQHLKVTQMMMTSTIFGVRKSNQAQAVEKKKRSQNPPRKMIVSKLISLSKDLKLKSSMMKAKKKTKMTIN